MSGKSSNHAWWAEQAKRFAAHFPGSVPTIIEIVSTYQNNGGTQFEFKRSTDYAGSMTHMRFASEGVDHENALVEYDRQGVEADLQVEPGDADMAECLRIMHRQFGKHRCVVGLGLDAEWYFTKQSPQKEGRPITDAEAKAWLETTLALNPKYTLFLKHFAPNTCRRHTGIRACGSSTTASSSTLPTSAWMTSRDGRGNFPGPRPAISSATRPTGRGGRSWPTRLLTWAAASTLPSPARATCSGSISRRIA